MSEEGSSEASSGHSNGSDDLDALCLKIHKKLAIPPDAALAVAAHKSATNAMLLARDALLSGSVASDTSKTALLCAGVSTYKRFHVTSEESSKASLQTTITLLFVLAVLCDSSSSVATGDEEMPDAEGEAAGEEGAGVGEDDRNLVRSWSAQSLAGRLFGEQATSWAAVLQDDSAVSRAALKCARSVGNADAMSKMWKLATVFFMSSSSAMTSALLGSAQVASEEGSCNFLTLDSMEFVNEANDDRETMLGAIVDAAESEAGQAIFRDLLLSFTLPCAVVGVRRTLLLSREANKTATSDHTELVNDAHNAAMRGAMHEWQSGTDVAKMCALLAGMAVILARGHDIRKMDAFDGKVALPFLQTSSSSGHTVGLVDRSFVCFTVKGNKPRVQLKEEGLHGLSSCILMLSRKLRKRT